MTRYLVGTETHLCVVERNEPIRTYQHHFDSKKRMASMPIGSKTFGFKVTRGYLEEFRSSDLHEHVYARLLPDDASEQLAIHDAEVSAARQALSEAQLRRQGFLAAVVVRAARIKVST
jgi:hypothetical protein